MVSEQGKNLEKLTKTKGHKMTIDMFLLSADVTAQAREEMVKKVAKLLFDNVCTNDCKRDLLDDFAEDVAVNNDIDYVNDGCEPAYHEIQQALMDLNDYDLCNDSVFGRKLAVYHICDEEESDTETEIVAELRKLLETEIKNRWQPEYLRKMENNQ